MSTFSYSSSPLSIVKITEKELETNNAALKQKLKKAAQMGFFYVEIPSGAKQFVPHATEFANSFHEDEKLKALELPGFSGYNNREQFQMESFFCEESLWADIYPYEVSELAKQCKDLAVLLMRKLFPIVLPHLSNDKWSQATGQLLQNGGLYHFSFNHYPTEISLSGVDEHQDFGYITLLYTDKEGLFAKIEDTWWPISPKEDCFIVNFGRAFELLVNDQSKLIGGWHRVEQITQEKHHGDRISFGLFNDNDLAFPLQRVTKEGALEIVYASYQQYLDNSFSDTYDDSK